MSNRLKIFAGAILGLALIYWFVHDLDVPSVLATIKSANWALLVLGVLLTMATYLIRAIRWKVLLDPVIPDIHVGNLFAATSLGFATWR